MMTITIPTWILITFIVLIVLRMIIKIINFNRVLKYIDELVKGLSGSGVMDWIKTYINK